jgi:D-alanyl-D-alanine carboxypeptidase
MTKRGCIASLLMLCLIAISIIIIINSSRQNTDIETLEPEVSEVSAETQNEDYDASTPQVSDGTPNGSDISSEFNDTLDADATSDAGNSHVYDDLPDIDITDWMYRLVNMENPLEDDFTVTLASVQNGQYFDSRAASSLSDLYLAARADNIPIILNSGYRNIATQRQLYEWRLNTQRASGMSEEEAIRTTLQIVAYPGASEHNLGLAVDILDRNYGGTATAAFANTELGIWLKENCAEYGFILRYPDGKTDITGVQFEPWHFRYVGEKAARFIMDNDLCLEEFLDLYS